jgi:integrase/recombinase XerC
MGKLPAPLSTEHSELLRAYRVDQERRGLLPSSVEHTGTKLRAFARWLEPAGTVLEATREDVQTFLDGRRTHEGRKLNSRTRYYWVAVLHGFYEWALAEDLTGTDPTARIVRPKQRRVLPRPIADDDLELAIRTAPPQMRAMLTLAALAGLRVQEIAGLDRDDVIEAKSLIRVRHGKGDKERIVPLHPTVLEALRCLPLPRTGAIFVRPRGGRFSGNRLSVVISAYLREHGINATAHQLRHWFATEVYAQGHDIRVVQELLGHSDPATTAAYVAYSHVDAAAAVRSLSISSAALGRAQFRR